jgi:carboxypeptidase Q
LFIDMKQLLIYALVALFVVVPSFDSFPQIVSPKETASAMMKEGMSKLQAYDLLAELTAIGPRLSGSENYEKAVKWAKAKMNSLGFENVRLNPAQIPHWVRGKTEFAEAVSSHGKKLPLTICALGGSAPTPANGITADVIEIHSFDELKKAAIAKGKIVFFNRPMDPARLNTFEAYGDASEQRTKGPSQAAAVGAVAVIVRSLTLVHDDVPHTGSLTYDQSFPRIPAAAVSTYDADALSALLKDGSTVRVTLKLDCQQLPDVASASVIGEIRGSQFPDQIVLVGGHLDSWDLGVGANDDGAGCAHTLEALSIIKRLGLKPKRTIRAVLFANEENGLKGARAYTDSEAKVGKHIACIETDAGGFSPRGFSVADPSALTKIQKWSELLSIAGAGEIVSGGPGADLLYLAKLGIPAIGFRPDSQRYFDYHHSTHDTLDKVHPRELELGAVAIAIMAYQLSENGL